MNVKIELKNFIEHYGLDETIEALGEIKHEAEMREEVLDVFAVYDNGGQTNDRYTAVNQATGEVYNLSADANSPQGVNVFAGVIGQDIDHPQGLDTTGERLHSSEVPKEIIKALAGRL